MKLPSPAMFAALKNDGIKDPIANKTNVSPVFEDFDIFFSEYDSANEAANKSDRFNPDLHGNLNLLLGSFILGGVATVIMFICYCCQKSIRKQHPGEYSQYSRAERDVSGLEIFSMDTHAVQNCYQGVFTENREDNAPPELTTRWTSPQILPNTRTSLWSSLSLPVPLPTPLPASSSSPPPTYESLMFSKRDRSCQSLNDVKDTDKTNQEGPPTVHFSKSYADIDISNSNLPKDDTQRDNEGLPSYEAALKLEADGYV